MLLVYYAELTLFNLREESGDLYQSFRACKHLKMSENQNF